MAPPGSPVAVAADKVIWNIPGEAGMPEMMPVDWSTDKLAGNGCVPPPIGEVKPIKALNLVGFSVAVIVYEKFVPTVALAVSGLVMTGLGGRLGPPPVVPAPENSAVMTTTALSSTRPPAKLVNCILY
jgi:hypothetical protein